MKLLLAGEAIFSLRMAVKKSNYTGEGGGGGGGVSGAHLSVSKAALCFDESNDH